MTAQGSRHIIFTFIELAILKYKVSHDLKEMLGPDLWHHETSVGVEVCPASRYCCPLKLKFG